jgi:hypothetical protein
MQRDFEGAADTRLAVRVAAILLTYELPQRVSHAAAPVRARAEMQTPVRAKRIGAALKRVVARTAEWLGL